MTFKLKQTKEQREEQCTHPNLEYDRLKKGPEESRRGKKQTKIAQANKSINRNLNVATREIRRMPSRVSRAAYYLGKARATMTDIAGDEFEEKVSTETNAKWTTIKFNCPDCGMSGEIDVVTDQGVVKECKVGTIGGLVSQFKKISRVAPLILGGSPTVHVAVPSGNGGAVRRAFRQAGSPLPSNAIQEH